MECPYCNNEMEKGIIRSPQEISWDRKKHWVGRAQDHEGSVLLSKLSIMKGSAVISYLCRDCKKVMIDYEAQHDLNDMK